MRVLLILMLAVQSVLGLTLPASNCGTSDRTAVAASLEHSCCADAGGTSCCGGGDSADQAAKPECTCSDGLCASVLGIECGSCGCEPDRPAAPMTPSGKDSRPPVQAAQLPVTLPPLSEPALGAEVSAGVEPSLSWLARTTTAGDRRALLCSLTT